MKLFSTMSCFLFGVAVIAGCAQECPPGFREAEEKGLIRCGYEDEEDEDGELIPVRCDVTSEEEPRCCTLGASVKERSCMSFDECEEEREEVPGITWNSECDDPTDCAVLYPDGSLPICCSSLKQRRAWCAEECPIIKADQNPNCLSTWNCPEDQVCVSLPFLAETYNCVMEDDQSFQ